MADIHANREALEACLAHAESRRTERIVFLGDYVNYGADPDWVVGTIMDLVAKGGPPRSSGTTTRRPLRRPRR